MGTHDFCILLAQHNCIVQCLLSQPLPPASGGVIPVSEGVETPLDSAAFQEGGTAFLRGSPRRGRLVENREPSGLRRSWESYGPPVHMEVAVGVGSLGHLPLLSFLKPPS